MPALRQAATFGASTPDADPAHGSSRFPDPVPDEVLRIFDRIDVTVTRCVTEDLPYVMNTTVTVIDEHG
jgi:hypothetical protein